MTKGGRIPLALLAAFLLAFAFVAGVAVCRCS